MESIPSIVSGILLGISVVAGIAFIIYKALQPKVEEKSKEKTPGDTGTAWSWATNPAALIAYGLIVFNLVSWAMIPWWWNILTDKWYTFVFFNLGFWTVLFLRTIKTKDKDGKDTKEDNPTASKMSSVIALVLILGIATTAWKQVSAWKNQRNTPSQASTRPTTTLSYGVPTETALQVIAECESGGKQFEEDGKTPLKNRGDAKKGIPPSSAFGKYQFLEAHREPAKKLGFDLNTEQGQDQYARYRFERYGMKDWDFDEDRGGGSACWGPKLAKLGGTLPPTNPELLGVVDVPTNEWSDVVVNASLGKIGWGRLDTTKGGNCEVMLDGDPQKVFSIKTTHPETTPRAVQFKCSQEGAKVRVRRVPNV